MKGRLFGRDGGSRRGILVNSLARTTVDCPSVLLCVRDIDSPLKPQAIMVLFFFPKMIIPCLA